MHNVYRHSNTLHQRITFGTLRILFLFLACSLVLFTMPVLSFADEEADVLNLSAELDHAKEDDALVADIEGPAAVFILRAEAVTTLDDQGNLCLDEDVAENVFTNLALASRAVRDNPDLKLTACVPGILLEYWRYDFFAFSYNDQTSFFDALDTQRMEMLTAGYADPYLPFVSSQQRMSDLAGQYTRSLNVDDIPYATGTYPAKGQMTRDAIAPLKDTGATWATVHSSTLSVTSAGNKPSCVVALSGASKDQITALVSSDSLSAALKTDDSTDFLNKLETAIASDAQNAAVCTADLTLPPAQFSSCLNAIQRATFSDTYTLATASSVVQRAENSTTALPEAVPTTTVQDESLALTDAFSRAERNLLTLSSCLYSSSSVFDDASKLVYLAEGAESTEGARVTSLNTATSLVDAMLAQVHIQALNMTFAGTEGEVPLTIVNNTDAALELTVTAHGQGITSSAGFDEGVKVVVYSGENFVEIPLTCQQERTDVTITIGGVAPIAQQTVWVKTTHINEVTLGVCGVALIIFVLFVARRQAKRKKQTATSNEDASSSKTASPLQENANDLATASEQAEDTSDLAATSEQAEDTSDLAAASNQENDASAEAAEATSCPEQN